MTKVISMTRSAIPCIVKLCSLASLIAYVNRNTTMAQNVDSESRKAIASDHSASTVQLTVLEIAPKFDGESYSGRFLLKNRSDRTIRVYGERASSPGPILARYVFGEVFDEGNWRSPKTFSDCIPLTIAVAPHENVEVLADLPFQEKTGATVKARIRWSQLVSDPFVIDWQSDRKAGRFDRARAAHVEKLRRALSKAGFSDASLRKDDFWSEWIEGLCRRIGAVKGFAPFRAKRVQLPNIDPCGRIEYYLWSDDVSESQYVYRLELTLDLPHLPLNWLHSAQFTRAYIDEVPASANRRQVYVALGDPNDAGFGLKLHYIPRVTDPLPSAAEIEKLTRAMLAELRGWAQESMPPNERRAQKRP